MYFSAQYKKTLCLLTFQKQTKQQALLQRLPLVKKSWDLYSYLIIKNKIKYMSLINSVRFGEIKIKGKTYYSDVVVDWEGNIELRKKSHVFDINEFTRLLERKPELIVIGTGFSECVKIPEEVIEISKEKGVKLFPEQTEKAMDVFNAFVSEKRKAIAVIHTTC